MAGDKKGEGPIIIKKYANRRLYNTGSSSYITLDDLAGMVREEVDFKVIDAKTGDDITHSILTQIILDQEASDGEPMLPVSFLRQLIGMYGNQMQSIMPAYLEATMAQFQEHQAKFREAFGKGLGGANPIARIHETNMAIMRAAAEAFIPGTAEKSALKAKKSETAPPAKDDELAAMRKQMEAMQARLDKLDS